MKAQIRVAIEIAIDGVPSHRLEQTGAYMSDPSKTQVIADIISTATLAVGGVVDAVQSNRWETIRV